jgi:hypothetical protein
MGTTMSYRNYREARAAGLVLVGEWGFSPVDAGGIFCRPVDLAAVRAAYHAMPEDDGRAATLAPVIAVGGVYVEDAPDDE